MLTPQNAVELFYDALSLDVPEAYYSAESPDEWTRRRAFVDGIYYALFAALKHEGWSNGVAPLVEAHARAHAAIEAELQGSVSG